MKDFGDEARAALAANEALAVGAVIVDTSPDQLKIWGGYGELSDNGLLGEDTFTGIGDKGLVDAVGATLGDAEQNITLTLSGIDPDTLSLFDMSLLRRAPVIVYRMLFDKLGQRLLAAPVFSRGRLDTATRSEDADGQATVAASVETAARGLGRGGGRIRSDADQRLIDPADDGLKAISYAGQVPVYWGGKLPATAQAAFGATPAGAGARTDPSNLQNF